MAPDVDFRMCSGLFPDSQIPFEPRWPIWGKKNNIYIFLLFHLYVEQKDVREGENVDISLYV